MTLRSTEYLMQLERAEAEIRRLTVEARRWNRIAANYAAGLSMATAGLAGERPVDEALDFARRALGGENVAESPRHDHHHQFMGTPRGGRCRPDGGREAVPTGRAVRGHSRPPPGGIQQPRMHGEEVR